jgi:integrase
MSPGAMQKSVLTYLSVRRRLGYDLRGTGTLLLDFARFAHGEEHEGPVTVDLAVRWATRPEGTRPGRHAQRLSVVRQFARHQSIIEPGTEIPPPGLLGPGYRRTAPYIYAQDEVRALLRAAATLAPIEGLRPRTYSALFGLLASTGLRVSEALRLTRSDVDLVAGVLTVRETKFKKSRLVPLHPSTMQALRLYAEQRERLLRHAREQFFFLADAGTALAYRVVSRVFVKLRRDLGWAAKTRPRAPRIHDLRHTFACRRLLAWYEEGGHINQQIPALSTYLGHAHVTDTYWYLSAVPELMAIAASRFERERGGKP